MRDTKRKRSGSFGCRNRFALIHTNIASFAGFSRQKWRENACTAMFRFKKPTEQPMRQPTNPIRDLFAVLSVCRSNDTAQKGRRKRRPSGCRGR